MITSEFVDGYFATIKVTEHSDEFLNAKRWVFSYQHKDHALKLDGFYELTRPTKRHNYKAKGVWFGGMDKRKNTMYLPPAPSDEVKQAAIQCFFENMKVS